MIESHTILLLDSSSGYLILTHGEIKLAYWCLYNNLIIIYKHGSPRTIHKIPKIAIITRFTRELVTKDVPAAIQLCSTMLQLLKMSFSFTAQCTQNAQKTNNDHYSMFQPWMADGCLGYNGILSTQVAAISCLRKFIVY